MIKSFFKKASMSIFLILAAAGILFAPVFFAGDKTETKAYAATETATGKEETWKTTVQGVPYALYYQNNDNPNAYYPRNDGSNFLLSSTAAVTHSPTDPFNNTVYFEFGNRDSNIKVISTALTVSATLNNVPIFAGPGNNMIENGYMNYVYIINLTDANMYYDNAFTTPIPIEDRDGKYVFSFTYSTINISNNVTTGPNTFTISFSVIDKSNYGENAITINNSGAPSASNIYLYNFNSDVKPYGVASTASFKETDKPVVSFDASLFGLSYSHSSRESNSITTTRWNFYSFAPTLTRAEAAAAPDGTLTGTLTLEREGTNTRVSYNIFKINNSKLYEAQIEISALGDYTFEISYLLNTGNTYQKIDIEDNNIETEQRHLIIFGYVINYYDQATSRYRELANNATQANAISVNSGVLPANGYTASHYLDEAHISGNIINMAAEIPVTNQAPIRFNFYGTLTSPGALIPAGMYKIFDTKIEALTFLDNVLRCPDSNTLRTIDRTLDTTYVSGSSFNKEGYYVVKVNYELNSTLDTSVEGSQYFIFAIDTALPQVYVQSVDSTEIAAALVGKYTNKNLRILMPIKEYAFNATLTVTYRFYPNYGTTYQTGTLILKSGSVDYIDTLGGSIACQQFVRTLNTGDNFTFPSSWNGYVEVYVTYGVSQSTFCIDYVIDSTNISGITLDEIRITPPAGAGETIYDKKTTIQSSNSNVMPSDLVLTSEIFSLAWAEKPWAKDLINTSTGEYTRQPSTVTVYRLPINNANLINIQLINATLNGSPSYYGLTNGWSTTNQLELINYKNSVGRGTTGAAVTSTNRLLSEHFIAASGIYLFYVEDLAGNYFYRIVMLDTSISAVIQETYIEGSWEPSYNPLTNPTNFVKNDTNLVFGTHKLIEMNSFADIFVGKLAGASFMSILKSTSFFAQSAASNHTITTSLKNYTAYGTAKDYIAIPITQIEYRIDDSLRNSVLTPSNNFWQVTIYARDQSPSPPTIAWGPSNFYGEHCYYFSITNKNNRSLIDYWVEMNFDNAEGQFWAGNQNMTANDFKYIPTRNGTNLPILEFRFRDNDETDSIFAIESISYKLYGFNYTDASASYPFSSVAESEVTVYPATLNTNSLGFLRATILNSTDATYTLPGKYEFTRTYKGGPNPAAPGYGLDSYQRTYTVYVDNNGIISTDYVNYNGNDIRRVGENISITLGKSTVEEYTFKNFFRSVTGTEPILTTNKLPVQLNIPASKYFLYNHNTDTGTISQLAFAQLSVELTYRASLNSPAISIAVADLDSVNGFWFITPELRNEGTYTVTIKDRTGYNDTSASATQKTNNNPTSFSWRFSIKHNAPTGYFTVDGVELTESIGTTNFATRAPATSKAEFNFTDPADPYSAKIAQITIKRIPLSGTAQTSIINLTDKNLLYNIALGNNNYDISSMQHSVRSFKVQFTKTEHDEFEGNVYYQYKYILELNIDYECTYEITLRYAADGTSHSFGEFVSTTYTLAIDRTKPTINIDKLLTQDTYLLDSGYYTQQDKNNNLINFKEEQASLSTTKPTIYDYTFGVNDDFKLTYNAADTLSYFYFREYNKYGEAIIDPLDPDGEKKVNISITPDNPYYNNPSMFNQFPRFNVNTYLRPGWGYMASYDNSIPLATIIKNITKQAELNGFYEIIERDLAGNYRAYTVYFGKDQTFSLLEFSATDASSSYVNTLNADVTAYKNLNIESFNVVLGWGTINLSPASGSRTPVKVVVTPYDSPLNKQASIGLLNNYFSQINSNSNHNFNLKTSCFTQTNKTVHIIYTDQKLPAPTIINNSNGTYTLRFPQYSNTSVLYLTKVYVSTSRDNYGNPYYNDITGKSAVPEKSGIQEPGSYYIKYTDNYNGDYEYIAHVGITQVPDSMKYVYYNGAYYSDSQTGNLYTGGTITVTYQTVIHSIRASINGAPQFEINDTSSPIYSYPYTTSSTSIYKEFKSFVLTAPSIEANYSASETVGGKITYTLYYYDKNGTLVETQSMIIYNELPQIRLMDTIQTDINLALNLSHNTMAVTSSPVKVEWDQPNIANLPLASSDGTSPIYSPSITVFRLDDNGNVTNSYTIASANHIISEPGYYRVQLSNDTFGNIRTVTFSIRKGSLAFYTVMDATNNGTLSASPLKLDISSTKALNTNNGEFDPYAPSIESSLTIINALKQILSEDTDPTLNEVVQIHPVVKTKRDIINDKLDLCNKKINQYYSLNNINVQLDATKALHTYTFTFINGAPSKATPAQTDALTTIYLIYGYDDPIFEELIAVTKMPSVVRKGASTVKPDVITPNGLKYVQPGSPPIDTTLQKFEALLTNTAIENGGVTLKWNAVSARDNLNDKRWYNSGNVVMLDYSYGNNSSEGNLGEISIDGLTSKIQITGSGQHTLVFRDLSGRIAEFKDIYSYDYYRLILLDQVIYKVNNATPVNNSVFNAPRSSTSPSAVIITIDQLYASYYATRSLEITVKRNGAYYYQSDENSSSYQFTFNQPGRYEVRIDARYRSTIGTGPLTTSTYNFVIIDPLSARLAYEFIEMPGYEVTRIVKNDVDITDNVKEYYIRQQRGSSVTGPVTPEEIAAYRLRELFISTQPFGMGTYTITASIKYNELLAPRVYEYSFKIDDSKPVITSDPPAGETTTGVITIRYNSATIYDQIGRSEIRIYTYNKDTNKFEAFGKTYSINAQNSADTISKITLDQTNDYYVQLVTSSGNVVTSLRINRAEPLNTLAIIVIVVVSITVIVLTIVFVKLRTRMKIR